MINNKKIPIYFMPGLAASSAIFENIFFEPDIYEFYYLEWKNPLKKETLKDYVIRLLDDVKHENPILIGVSFGGIVIQEMAKYITTRQLIVISSVVHESEFPSRMKWVRNLKLYYLFPTFLFSNFDYLKYFMLGKSLKKRLEMYKKFLYRNDKKYLDWAIETILNWKAHNMPLQTNLVRIHGERDEVFPFKNINLNQCFIVPKATHAMIVYKYKWFNQNLPIIIKQTNL